MSGKGTTNAMCCLKNVDGKVQGRSKRATLCIHGPRESLQEGSTGKAMVLYKKIRNTVKIYAIVQGMYEESETVVRCTIGTTESFKVKVGLHQGSVLSPFLFAVIVDRITNEVKKQPPWTMLFADDIVICEETRKKVEWSRILEVCIEKKRDESK